MVKNIGDVNEHGDMSMELDDLEIGTMSQADKIKAIAGDLGVEASGKGKLEKSATPESDQPDIEDPREEEDDGSTAQSGKDINKQYDYFCPTHQQFVKGNICPGNGEEHQIDDRFMVQREKDGDKKAAKQMDVEASIIRMHNHPAVRDLEKGLGDPSNMRGRMDIIKGEVGFGKATMQKSLDRGTGKADLSKEIAVKIDNLCKSVKEHVNSVKEQIGETQADRIMANIETLQKSMTAAINKGAFKLAMSGIGIVRELENSLPAPTKGKETEKGLINNYGPTDIQSSDSKKIDPKAKKELEYIKKFRDHIKDINKLVMELKGSIRTTEYARMLGKWGEFIECLDSTINSIKYFDPKSDELNKALGAEMPGHKYIRRESKPGGGYLYIYKDNKGQQFKVKQEEHDWIQGKDEAKEKSPVTMSLKDYDDSHAGTVRMLGNKFVIKPVGEKERHLNQDEFDDYLESLDYNINGRGTVIKELKKKQWAESKEKVPVTEKMEPLKLTDYDNKPAGTVKYMENKFVVNDVRDKKTFKMNEDEFDDYLEGLDYNVNGRDSVIKELKKKAK